MRALTPSEAAERVVPDRAEVLGWLGELEGRLRTLLLRGVQSARERLADLADRRFFRAPLDRLREEERRLYERGERLARAARQWLAARRERLGSLAGRLEALSPLNVLARGYSVTRNEIGAVVRDAEQVRPGERVVVRLQRGRVVGRVEECYGAEGP